MSRRTKLPGEDEARRLIICEKLQAGHSRRSACACARIHFTTFYRWLQNEAKFAEDVELAEAECTDFMLGVIAKAAQGFKTTKTTTKITSKGTEQIIEVTEHFDWTAAKFWLQKMNRKEFGDNSKATEDIPPDADADGKDANRFGPQITEVQVITLLNDMMAMGLIEAGISVPKEYWPPVNYENGKWVAKKKEPAPLVEDDF